MNRTKEQALSTSCNFLKHIYQDNFNIVAALTVLEADKSYDGIAEELVRVKEFIDELIKELKQ